MPTWYRESTKKGTARHPAELCNVFKFLRFFIFAFDRRSTRQSEGVISSCANEIPFWTFQAFYILGKQHPLAGHEAVPTRTSRVPTRDARVHTHATSFVVWDTRAPALPSLPAAASCVSLECVSADRTCSNQPGGW